MDTKVRKFRGGRYLALLAGGLVVFAGVSYGWVVHHHHTQSGTQETQTYPTIGEKQWTCAAAPTAGTITAYGRAQEGQASHSYAMVQVWDGDSYSTSALPYNGVGQITYYFKSVSVITSGEADAYGWQFSQPPVNCTGTPNGPGWE